MPNVSGTLRKLSLDGVPYDVAADINVTMNQSPFETEGVPTSGRTMYKMTLRTPTAEGITIVAPPTEQQQLIDLASRLETFPMAATLADGSVWRTVGKINYESLETEENRAGIVIIPDRAVDGWSLFAA